MIPIDPRGAEHSAAGGRGQRPSSAEGSSVELKDFSAVRVLLRGVYLLNPALQVWRPGSVGVVVKVVCLGFEVHSCFWEDTLLLHFLKEALQQLYLSRLIY